MDSIDDLKTSLIDWMKSKPEFEDFDFDTVGSGIDLITSMQTKSSYDTQLNNTLTINEGYVSTLTTDTAIFRKASELGYNITNRLSSTVTVKITGHATGNVTIPKYTKFSSTDNVYQFVTFEDFILNNDGLGNVEGEIILYQGYIYNYSDTINEANQIIRIPNVNIDSNKFYVEVRRDSIVYKPQLSTNVVFDNNVYYKQIVDQGYVEIFTGNDDFQIGDLISIDYIVTDGTEANGINQIKILDELGIDNIVVESLGSSYGGKDSVDIKREKTNLKNYIQAQNRAVTVSDYESILYSNFPYFNNIFVYGGENAYPKQYNKVFIVVDLNGGQLTDILKDQINNTISRYNIVNIKTEVEEVDNLFISILGDVNANDNIDSTVNLSALVEQKIDEYFSEISDMFSISQLETSINSIDDVKSNYLNIIGSKTINPYNAVTFEVDFGNELSTLQSTVFTIDSQVYYLKLDNGNINMYSASQGGELYKSNVGTLTDDGILTVNNILINEEITFNVTFKDNDIKRIRKNKFKKGEVDVEIGKN